jgi:hypothetical protein
MNNWVTLSVIIAFTIAVIAALAQPWKKYLFSLSTTDKNNSAVYIGSTCLFTVKC